MSAPRPVSVLLASIALVSIAQLALATAAHPPAIVERSFDAHGASVVDHSTTRFRMCSKSGCVAIRARFDGGLFEYEVIEENGRRRAHMDNDSIAVWEQGKPVALDATDRQRMRDWVSEKVYFPFLPLRLRDPSVVFEDRGLVDWNGESLHLVKVGFESGTSTSDSSRFLFWFDPASGRQRQFAYSFRDGLRFRRAVTFHEASGLVFSDQENYGVDGEGLDIERISPTWLANEARLISTVTLTEIEVQPDPPSRR